MNITVTVPRCPKCGNSDQVIRVRVTTEYVDLTTNKIIHSDGPFWMDDYECACGAKWDRHGRTA